MSSVRAYYEEYWRSAAGDAVESDPLTPARLREFGRVVSAPARVLDAGCGTGATTSVLRRLGYRAVGIELSHEALSSAAGAELPLARCAVDAALPFGDETFDAVYCAEVLEHLFDPGRAISELARVTRIRGHVVVSVPFHGMIKNVLIALTSFETHFDPVGQHIRFFTRRSLVALFEEAGLRVKGTRTLGRCWPVHMNMLIVGEKR